MGCCLNYAELCGIDNCTEWIVTTLETPEGWEESSDIDYTAEIKFNGVTFPCEIRYNNGFLEVKNNYAGGYTYTLKVESLDGATQTCYKFTIQLKQCS